MYLGVSFKNSRVLVEVLSDVQITMILPEVFTSLSVMSTQNSTKPQIPTVSGMQHTVKHSLIPWVVAGFGGFACLFVLLAYGYQQYLQKLEQVIVRQEKESQEMLIISELMEVARTRTQVTAKILDLEDPFEQDELSLHLDKLAARFAVLRSELLALEADEEETYLLGLIPEQVRIALPAQRRVVELAMSGDESDRVQAHEIYYEIVLPAQSEIIRLFSELITHEQQHIAMLSHESGDSIRTASRNVYLLSGCVLVMIFAISFVVVVRIRKVQKALFDANENLEQTVLVRTSELSKAQSMLKTVIDTIPVRVFWKDLDGVYLGVNRLFAEDAGYASPDEIVGKKGDALNWPEHRIRQCRAGDREVITTGQAIIDRIDQVSDAAGNSGWQEYSKAPLRDVNGVCIGVLGVYHDITARVIAEQKLKESKQAAEAANEEKRRFLANMNHELRTPMNGVLGLAELLKTTELDQEQREYVLSILQSGQHLLGIINNILAYSRLDNSKVTLKHKAFNLRNVVELVLQDMSRQCQEKDIRLQLEYAQDVPQNYLGDDGVIDQLLRHLLGNALKFTERGYIRLSMACTGLEYDAASLEVVVQDSGVGISEQQQSKLFDSFSQADDSVTREFGGAGLGLSICKRLVELMGGCIEIESEPGQGATFRIKLTLALDDQAEPAQTVFRDTG